MANGVADARVNEALMDMIHRKIAPRIQIGQLHHADTIQWSLKSVCVVESGPACRRAGCWFAKRSRSQRRYVSTRRGIAGVDRWELRSRVEWVRFNRFRAHRYDR